MTETQTKTIKKAIKAACEAEGLRECTAEVRLIDDAQMREINRENRCVDATTDVLSFPYLSYKPGKTARDCPKKIASAYDPEYGLPNLGDVFISPARVEAQAIEYGHSLTRELAFLTAHAMLHLMGYDHVTDDDRASMRAMEDKIMDSLNIPRDPEDERLFLRACEALKNAYVPYSGYRVGACIITKDGREFTGCNIENASYGATICAERAAVSKAVSEGARRFTAIAIAGERGASWPCGICRQVLNEFSLDMRVIVGQAGGAFDVTSLKELLPNSFGPEELQTKEE